MRLIGLFILLLFIAAFWPGLDNASNLQHADFLLKPPSSDFLFGTDELGRDLFKRVLVGAKVSLSCALLATLLSGIFGVLYGSLAGYLKGKTDQILMRLLDVLYAIPDLLFYILLGLFLGRGFWGILIALASLSWVGLARITRGEILKHKEAAFIMSAKALGLTAPRILLRHLLPQIMGPVIVTLLFKIPSVIMAESALSFIGLGLSPPHASWGILASEGFRAMRFYPHLIFFPSLFLCLTILSFQTLGAALQKRMRV